LILLDERWRALQKDAALSNIREENIANRTFKRTGSRFHSAVPSLKIQYQGIDFAGSAGVRFNVRGLFPLLMCAITE